MQAVVCIGFTAAIIWRVNAAMSASAARDEERPLLDDMEGGTAACAGSPKHTPRTGRLVHCAAVALVGGMAAGLVGLVRTHAQRADGSTSICPSLPTPGAYPVSAIALSGLLDFPGTHTQILTASAGWHNLRVFLLELSTLPVSAAASSGLLDVRSSS